MGATSERESGSDEDYSDGGHSMGMDDSSATDEESEQWRFQDSSPLLDESHIPLFAGSDLSRLEATLLFVNVLRTHKATNACINEILNLLAKVILPKPNSMPTSEGNASNMLTRLGLRYESIDVCKNGCVLFRDRNAEMESCPICNVSRFRRVGMSKVPHKVLRHFPLIPRLRRMFSTPHLAALMTWHGQNVSSDGKMRGPCDSRQWEHIRVSHSEFESDNRNIHLGLCADGLNPHSQKRSTHSLWPVMLLNDNIPPWLTIKSFFIILALLIPGPESVTADRIDVFLTPLIDELRELWTVGVPCYDAARWRGETRFTLKAILMWCIHDFPAYAMLTHNQQRLLCMPGLRSEYRLAVFITSVKKRLWGPASEVVAS